jgi:regulator of Ty1 transposition protein 103
VEMLFVCMALISGIYFCAFFTAKDNRKLTFMYLANDVIQNSKKKGPEFGKEFGNVLRKAFENMAVPESDEKTRKSIERILQIWEERGVYEPKLIKEFRRGLGVYQIISSNFLLQTVECM